MLFLIWIGLERPRQSFIHSTWNGKADFETNGTFCLFFGLFLGKVTTRDLPQLVDHIAALKNVRESLELLVTRLRLKSKYLLFQGEVKGEAAKGRK